MRAIMLWKKLETPFNIALLLWWAFTLYTSLSLLYATLVLIAWPFIWYGIQVGGFYCEMFLYQYLDSLTSNLFGWALLAKWMGGGFGGLILACIYGTPLAFFAGILAGWLGSLFVVYVIYGVFALRQLSK